MSAAPESQQQTHAATSQAPTVTNPAPAVPVPVQQATTSGVAAPTTLVTAKPPTTKMPTKAYLETYLVPTLVQAMESAAKRRPDDPVEFVAQYLLENNPKRLKPTEGQPQQAVKTEPAVQPQQ